MSADGALRVAFLHGFRDEPTDGIEDYAARLGGALADQGVAARSLRLPLAETALGPAWPREALAPVAGSDWALLQYTAFQWSRRALPFGLARLLRELGSRAARVGVVFHDADGMWAAGPLHRLRCALQRRIMRSLAARADLAVSTVNLEHAPWSRGLEGRLRHLPVGANLEPGASTERPEGRPLTLSLFCVTGGARGDVELARLDTALQGAAAGAGGAPLRLVAFGRGVAERRTAIEAIARARGAEPKLHGLLEDARVAQLLAGADFHLFLRGQAMTNRTSLLAAVAAGLPVACVSEGELLPPLSEAGLLPARAGDAAALRGCAAALAADAGLRATLASRSRASHAAHFAWPVLASRLAGWLRDPGSG